MKKIIPVFLAFFLFAGHAYAYQVLVGGTTGNMAANTGFGVIGTQMAVNAGSENNSFGATPFGGTIANLYVRLSNAPGAGTSRTFTLHDNAASTTVACTISDTNTTCSDTVDSFVYQAGDTLTYEGDVSGSPAVAQLTMSVVSYPFQPGNIMLVYRGTNPPNSAQSFAPLTSGSTFYGATENTALIADAGTIDSYFTNFQTSPAAGRTYAMLLRQNGTNTSLTCTVSNPTTGCRDTTDSFSVSSGDSLAISSTPAVLPAAINNGGAVRFRSNDGATSLFVGSTYSVADAAAATRFIVLQGDKNIATGEAAMQQIIAAPIILTNFVASSTAPGGATTRAFTVRLNGANTALTCTLTGAQTNCSSSGAVAVRAGDLLSVSDVGGTGAATGNPVISVAATNYTGSSVLKGVLRVIGKIIIM